MTSVDNFPILQHTPPTEGSAQPMTTLPTKPARMSPASFAQVQNGLRALAATDRFPGYCASTTLAEWSGVSLPTVKEALAAGVAGTVGLQRDTLRNPQGKRRRAQSAYWRIIDRDLLSGGVAEKAAPVWMDLPSNAKAIWEALVAGGTVRTVDLATQIGCTDKTARTICGRLVTLGAVAKAGRGAWAPVDGWSPWDAELAQVTRTVADRTTGKPKEVTGTRAAVQVEQHRGNSHRVRAGWAARREAAALRADPDHLLRKIASIEASHYMKAPGTPGEHVRYTPEGWLDRIATYKASGKPHLPLQGPRCPIAIRLTWTFSDELANTREALYADLTPWPEWVDTRPPDTTVYATWESLSGGPEDDPVADAEWEAECAASIARTKADKAAAEVRAAARLAEWRAWVDAGEPGTFRLSTRPAARTVRPVAIPADVY